MRGPVQLRAGEYSITEARYAAESSVLSSGVKTLFCDDVTPRIVRL